MKIIKYLLILILGTGAVLVFLSKKPQNLPPANMSDTDLILFWGDGCPHCENVKKHIDENNLSEKIKITQLEVYYNKENQATLSDTIKKCSELKDSQNIGVPFAYAPKDNRCLLGDQPIIDYLMLK